MHSILDVDGVDVHVSPLRGVGLARSWSLPLELGMPAAVIFDTGVIKRGEALQ